MKIIEHNKGAHETRAVVTRAKDDYEVAKVTHPNLKAYAERCKADFIVINEEKINLGHFGYEIFQCYELFERYERILNLDSDVVLTPSCPNLFDVVPYDKIGCVYEDKYTRKADRLEYIRKCQQQFGDVGWRKGYINTGVFLLSRCHKNVFTFEPEKVWNDLGYDDVLIGYNIHKYGYQVYELPYKFNHMSMFSEMGRNRLKSYIIHYAGRGFSSRMDPIDQIRSDLHKLQRTSNPFFLNFYNIPQRLRLIALSLKYILDF